VVFVGQEVAPGGYRVTMDQPLVVLAGVSRGHVRVVVVVELAQRSGSRE
jgi:hypothetical protein